MYSFCGGDIFVMQMIFYVDMLNIKVVDNFLIFPVLKFHDFGPDGLWVIYFRSLMRINTTLITSPEGDSKLS